MAFFCPSLPSPRVTVWRRADATDGVHAATNADAAPDGPDAADAPNAADAAADASRHVGVADANGSCGEALLL